MKNKKETKTSLSEKDKLAKKIHKWAFLDAQKYPQKFAKQFDEIFRSQFTRKR